MATSISNGESGLSVRTKLNDIWHSLDLNEYNKEILDTAAVDVFVYDTSKDSDGGAWRKRTQGTSWYNETLNTSTRGSRKEFPAVAVIVAESNGKVTIYDGDDPDLPMWMIFPATSYTTWATIGTISSTSISMLNGKLGVVTNDGGVLVDYLSDKATLLYSSTTYGLTSSDTVEGRNQASSFTSGVGQSIALVYWSINDVAMTVLPNAPIDAATGLPVPTIAVATNGGVSVIKDDGTVVDITSSSGFNGIQEIDFTDDNKLVYTMDSASNARAVRVDSIPAADFNVTSNQLVKGNGEEFYTGADFGYPAGDLNLNLPTANSVTKVVGSNLNDREIATTNGMTKIALANQSDPSTGMVAYTTSDYNTGWMNGDIKGAFLSDTDDTDLVGSELVTSWINGTTYAYDTFTASGTSITSAITDGSDFAGTASNAITVTSGKHYVVSFNLTLNSGTAPQVYFVNSQNGGAGFQSNQAVSVSGNNSITLIPTTTGTVYLQLRHQNGVAGNFATGDVSVRLAEEDRSVNGNGLQVFGTVTKSAVATGADLVAYSGFSGSNYLVQPPNSDLDFGTGDMSAQVWFNMAALSGGTDFGFSVTGSDLEFAINSSTTLVNIAGTQVATSTTMGTGNWTHLLVCRSNGIAYLYINGELKDSISATGNIDASTTLYVGNRSYDLSTRSFAGSLALFRISATAPSPQQILKIYNDEKHLFTEGAQATFYGSSDSVTALAYDTDSELLHVGTSAGRSVFQGLRRVDNTTDAITAAISASNGLVAEE